MTDASTPSKTVTIYEVELDSDDVREGFEMLLRSRGHKFRVSAYRKVTDEDGEHFIHKSDFGVTTPNETTTKLPRLEFGPFCGCCTRNKITLGLDPSIQFSPVGSPVEPSDEPSALQTERDVLCLTLGTLVRKLDAVHVDSRYKAVWESYMLHGGRYREPTYTAELDAARKLLGSFNELPREEPRERPANYNPFHAMEERLEAAVRPVKASCVCGNPSAPGIAHRTKGPCFWIEENGSEKQT